MTTFLSGSQYQTSSGASATTSAFTSREGDVIVVGVEIPSTSIYVTKVQDDAGNQYLWRAGKANTSGGVKGEIWVARGAAASTTNVVTVTLS